MNEAALGKYPPQRTPNELSAMLDKLVNEMQQGKKPEASPALYDFAQARHFRQALKEARARVASILSAATKLDLGREQEQQLNGILRGLRDLERDIRVSEGRQ